MTLSRIFVAATLLVLLSWSPTQAGNVGCSEIMKRTNRHVSTGRGEPADISLIARELDTSIPWVEHCMRMYGRRAKRPGLESPEEREKLLEAREADEPEESAREDIEEGGARERPERPIKPRYMDYRFTPTPELGYRQRLDGFQGP